MNAVEFTNTGLLGFTEGALGTKGFKPSATLNPYKYFASGLAPNQDVTDYFSDPVKVEKRGWFRTAEVNTRHYKLIWPEGPITFQYAVLASWEICSPVPPSNIPDDFPIEANSDEAFHIAWFDNDSTAYYEGPGSYGGNLKLKIEVFDWGVLGHDTVIADEIDEISFESPGGLIPTPVSFDPATLPAYPGTAVSSVFDVEIVGVHPTGLTGQTVVCRITSAIHETYDYGFGVPVASGPLASFIIFDAPIGTSPSGDKPTAIAEACDCLWIAPGQSVTFDGTQSFSPNGEIVLWEWDFDGNGTFGDSHTGPMHHPTRVYNTAGTYNVNLQVTDEIGQKDTLDPDQILVVHVGTFTPPTAKAYICPTIGFINHEGDFKGSGSTGTIDLYEWDFECDCIWDYEHPTIGDTTHAYPVPDIYPSVLRVTGNGCDSVITDVRMIDPLPILANGNFWDGEWGDWEPGHGGIGGVTYIKELVHDDIFRHKVHLYRCCTNDGGTCWVRQFPYCDVTEYDELFFNLFFYIEYDELYGDGWMSGEMAMAVRISYFDADSNNWMIYLGWDTAFDGTWQWDTNYLPSNVTYHSQEVVGLHQWHEKKSIDLMTIDPKPVEIAYVLIGSFGWDFETYIGPVWFSEE